MRRISGIDAVGDGLDVGSHDGQRRAQLVRHVGQEAAAFSLVDGQACAHLVEGPCQRAGLAWTALRDLHVEIAGLDTSGRCDQVVDGLGQAPQPAGAAGHGQHHEHEDGQPDHDADGRAGPDETGVGPGHGRHEHGAEGDEDDDRAADSLGRPRTASTPRAGSPGAVSPCVPRSLAARARSRATRAGGDARSCVELGESIADAVDRLKITGRTRIGLDLAPDVLDVRIDRPFVALEGDAVYGVEEL